MTSASDTTSVTSWFAGRLPAEWTATPPSIEVDRDEITVTITIDTPTMSGDPSDIDVSEVTIGRIAAFRDDTRERRMGIAREAEHRFERKVSWAVAWGVRLVGKNADEWLSELRAALGNVEQVRSTGPDVS